MTQEHWPDYTPSDVDKNSAASGKADYLASGRDWRPYRSHYIPITDYFRWGALNMYTTLGDHMQWGEDGVPMVDYGGAFYYNPITTSQFALWHYSRNLHGKGLDDVFGRAVTRLLSLQNEEGGFEHPFSYGIYDPGWTSGMAQGQALSVLSRAYVTTNDDLYLSAGRKAFNFLNRPTSEGGHLGNLSRLDPSLSGYVTIEEYPFDPDREHTLNGFVFATFGLYDWSILHPDHIEAESLFKKCITTIKNVLHYYDIGGFSAYNLRQAYSDQPPSIPWFYHMVMCYLTYGLYSITSEPVFRLTNRLWAQYVNQLW